MWAIKKLTPIIFFLPSSKLWRLKVPKNPLQVYAEIPCISGFHFQEDHSLFLGQAESPPAVGAARLAQTDCGSRGSRAPGYTACVEEIFLHCSTSSCVLPAGVFGLGTDAEVKPSPCTARFCVCSHPQRGLGTQLGCSHTAKASCRKGVLSNLSYVSGFHPAFGRAWKASPLCGGSPN